MAFRHIPCGVEFLIEGDIDAARAAKPVVTRRPNRCEEIAWAVRTHLVGTALCSSEDDWCIEVENEIELLLLGS